MKSFFLVLFLVSSLSASITTEISRLRKHVSALVHTEKPRSFRNPDVLDSVASYIRTQFLEYGYNDVREQPFMVRGRKYRNIIASVGPQNGKKVILGAHYDVFGENPGADDNASGVAGVLESARLLYQNRDALKSRVEFVAYSLEEEPFFKSSFMGSYVHASECAGNPEKVELMICFEMIGCFRPERKAQDYPLGILEYFYGSKGDYITTVSNFRSWRFARRLNRIFNRDAGLPGKYIVAPRWLKGVDFSDHRNYWNHGINAIMITDTAFYRNEYYHTGEDTPDKLDFDKMGKVVTGTVLFLLQI